ncbi:hypothetical protein CON22_26115 [Bacillus cereus]|nr:hypothetical protein CON22_26115 [Bacillus cereus]
MWKTTVLLLISSIMLVAIVGCSNNGKEDKKGSKDLGLNISKKTDILSIKLTSAKIVENELNTDVDHVTLELGVEAKNLSKEDADIGTGDFTIKTEDGKTYKFTGSENNFGDVIKSGETIKGKGYYSIPKDKKKMIVIYKPYKSTEQLKWDIEIKG